MTWSPDIVGLIAAVGALILAVSALRGQKLNFRSKAWMAGLWVAIILGLVAILSWWSSLGWQG